MELEEAIAILKYELDKSKIVKKYQGKPEELFDDLDEYIKSIETVLNHLTKQEKMIEILLDLYWNKEQARLIIEYGLESKKQLRKEIEKKAEE